MGPECTVIALCLCSLKLLELEVKFVGTVAADSESLNWALSDEDFPAAVLQKKPQKISAGQSVKVGLSMRKVKKNGKAQQSKLFDNFNSDGQIYPVNELLEER